MSQGLKHKLIVSNGDKTRLPVCRICLQCALYFLCGFFFFFGLKSPLSWNSAIKADLAFCSVCVSGVGGDCLQAPEVIWRGRPPAIASERRSSTARCHGRWRCKEVPASSESTGTGEMWQKANTVIKGRGTDGAERCRETTAEVGGKKSPTGGVGAIGGGSDGAERDAGAQPRIKGAARRSRVGLGLSCS